MKTYYELLRISPKATTGEIHALFRRFTARYRPTLTVEQIVTDERYRECLNAYLTLYGPLRGRYDVLLTRESVDAAQRPHPLDDLSATERHMLVARVAYWRREMTEATHQLRFLLEKEPGYAPAWALLGEINLTVGRLSEGVKAYQRAVHADPANKSFAARLQHAQDAEAGKIVVQIESSPEEELLREARKKRWQMATLLGVFGLCILAYGLVFRVTESSLGFLDIPWRNVVLLAVGMMVLMAALAYGRLLQPFEQVMVWSTTTAGDRGRVHNYPNGLLFFVLSLASLWLAIVGFVIISLMEDDWPYSTIVLLLLCALAAAGMALMLYHAHCSWGNMLFFGGNTLAIAGMFGWLMGSYSIQDY